jgi:hypothetical protein
MSSRKLKGMVLDETLNNIRHNAVRTTTNTTNGEVTYWTDKSVFLAKKRGIRYWDIYQLHGISGNEG